MLDRLHALIKQETEEKEPDGNGASADGENKDPGKRYFSLVSSDASKSPVSSVKGRMLITFG